MAIVPRPATPARPATDPRGGVSESDDLGTFEDALGEIDAAGPGDAGINVGIDETKIPATGEIVTASRHGLDLNDPIASWVEDLFNQTPLVPTGADDELEPADGELPAAPSEGAGAATGAEGGSPAPAAGAPAGPTYTVGGVEFTEEQLIGAIATAGQLEQLPQRTRSEIAGYLAGQYNLVPQGQAHEGAAAPVAQPSPSPAPVTAEPIDWEDPDQVRATVESLQARVDHVQTLSAAAVQTQAAAANAEHMASVERGIEAFKTATNIADENVLAAVMQRAQHLTAPLAAANPGVPVDRIIHGAMVEAAWGVPESRTVLLELEAQTRLDARQDELAQTRQRKTKAGALAGSPSGSLPRQVSAPAPDPRKQTAAQRDAALLQAVTGWMTQAQ